MDYLSSIFKSVIAIIGNWFILYTYQLRLVGRHLTSEPAIRDRALQCLLPPTILLLTSIASLSFILNNPRLVVRPAQKALPAIPWTLAVFGIGLFAIIARPALWDHQCDSNPIRVNPNDRLQWQEVWRSMNGPNLEEPKHKYRARMEKELDTWAEREKQDGDLEAWINLSSEAIAKRDCLNQKDELFRETWKEKRGQWERMVNQQWEKSTLREWWMASMFQAVVCRPEPQISMWAQMIKRARELGLKT